MKQNVLMQAKQLTRSITVYIQLGLRGAGDPSRACHVCAGEVAGVRSPASSPWWLGFFTPFMERGVVLGLEAPEVLCFQDTPWAVRVCARTPHTCMSLHGMVGMLWKNSVGGPLL